MFRAMIVTSWLLAGILSASGSGGGTSDLFRLPSVFEGRFTWHQPGAEAQSVVVQILSRTMDANGNIVATGLELYSVGPRFKAVDVKLTINPRTLRFELVELPGPNDFAQDSSVGQPIIGSISPDLKLVQSNLAEGDSGVFPDFVLRAVERPRPLARLAPLAP